ncbi:hypothetical protein [Sphaerisporangium dianthi]|uniref:Uncharacterized protein n=1 Tax=Sphaerisporangium dianthi TaxID=1436120 RepID=A0ABV9CCJ5_9ACTN
MSSTTSRSTTSRFTVGRFTAGRVDVRRSSSVRGEVIPLARRSKRAKG